MLKVTIPTDNIPERTYALKALLETYLGLPFQIEQQEQSVTCIAWGNDDRLVFEDHFFRHYPAEKSYLHPANIPSRIGIVRQHQNPFIPEENLPVIFGNEQLEVTDTRIVCGIDVPASLFFMLTRWEEHVAQDADEHGRFPAASSLAFKHGFLNRPVVNEMVEMVWNMLTHLGYPYERKQHNFQAVITHDVDVPRLWSGFPKFVKKLGGDLLVRRDVREFFFSLKSYPLTALRMRTDPFDTFDDLMDLSEAHQLRSHFFFMSGGVTRFDNFFDIRTPHIRNLIQRIHERGHVIGFHPSYNACTDERLFAKELSILREVSPQPVFFGRQHFLRFKVPLTWQIWEDNGLAWESSMGYPEEAGFRCGTCMPFPVFNILTRRQLSLLEIPLVAMEVSYVKYRKTTPEAMLNDLKILLKKVKKYDGHFALLWHNSSFSGPEYDKFRAVYPALLAEMTAL